MSLQEKASHEIREQVKVLTGEKAVDKQYSSERQMSDEDSAQAEFNVSKRRLFDVNAWSSIPAIANSRFQLHGRDGIQLNTERVKEGDFIMIDLPGPLPYYWVKVTEVTEQEDMAEFTVQPTYDPTVKEDKTVTAHFFQDQARSTFRVQCQGTVISAHEIGVDEAINNQSVEAGGKGLVNTLVAQAGWAGFQQYQWKNLTEFLVGL